MRDKRAKRLQDCGSGAALVVGSWERFRAAVARDLKGQRREEMRGKIFTSGTKSGMLEGRSGMSYWGISR